MIKKDYNLGLDIGATSVGFAGIDEQYDPIKLKGKTVVGVTCTPRVGNQLWGYFI
ncbi:hypothetical protein [Limosilactobacillus reuteri]|uniref:hypothetical protein n=1 Tax=Limosilactobacillus reuteri TaxID=1598 RepID=UPI001E60B4FC|nr:hypothetical protein [Limosilactobacillus reuteri]MCC4429466.1 hypothetical protein [Limosilactobacillus reuteri]